MNVVVLMGRLTAEPELKSTQSGLSVCSGTIAVDDPFGKDGKKANFIRFTAWRQTAEFISRYFHKGSMIAVEGSIDQSQYTDQNGEKRSSFQVVVNRVHFCGSKAESENEVYKKNEGYKAPDNINLDFEPVDDDDLPF